jgi:predicted GNAT family N-acyltransferase
MRRGRRAKCGRVTVKIGKRGKATSQRLLGKKLIFGPALVEKINTAV